MEEKLKRLGIARESAARLGRKAADFERYTGVHGVSVTAGIPIGPASIADRTEVERYFSVLDAPTRSDPLHKTVILPKPVDQEVADDFNQIFGRG